jgi:Gly-Xaa carboxypeptidase
MWFLELADRGSLLLFSHLPRNCSRKASSLKGVAIHERSLICANRIRSLIYSFGFDEEIGGPRGAKKLAEVILDRYGPDGVAMILDEGFTGVDMDHGQSFARLGLAEKGCLTVKLQIATPGGHSSSPPPHTGIGIMSEIVVAMEANPAKMNLVNGNPLLGYLECLAEYGNIEQSMRDDIRDSSRWPALAERLSHDKKLKPFLGTTQVST